MNELTTIYRGPSVFTVLGTEGRAMNKTNNISNLGSFYSKKEGMNKYNFR